MDWRRLALVTILEVLKELTARLAHRDLSEKCGECLVEIEAATAEEEKGGMANG